ncbi:hypothetical protein B0H11DRAFT_2086074 [Mycena galericulata]|nr:hypothetical protein B0H11DRAFT_2088926 [Mycena galericulata]KAJ7445964.1 hypothetical protein B0H11DRAFT_2086074 [Mycena galericulata]
MSSNLCSTHDDQSEQKFPLELELRIFETAARRHPETMPTLLRVARRVCVWIEPLLYETLIIGSSLVSKNPFTRNLHNPALLDALEMKPAAFLKENVRNLLIYGYINEETLSLLFPACSGVQNLAVYLTRPTFLLPHLGAMKFRRLEIFLRQMFYPALVDLSLPAFAALTHLGMPHDNLSGAVGLDELQTGLASLPCLTHLHLADAPRSFLSGVLSNCQRLQVLISWYNEWFTESLPDRCRELSIDDPRFILMATNTEDFPGDWKAGTQGGLDYWAMADLFVAKRRRGEVQPPSRCWIESFDMLV